MDKVIGTIEVLAGPSGKHVLDNLAAALQADLPLNRDQAILAAYVAGVEDALTGTAGRTEYGLRLGEFIAMARSSVLETGRAIGDATMADVIAQARHDAGT